MKLLLSLVIMMVSAGAWAQAGKQTAGKGSVIRGSQEQPKVLYIVPWQPPASPGMEKSAPRAELDGVLKPLDRDFHRQSRYFQKHLKPGVLSDRQEWSD